MKTAYEKVKQWRKDNPEKVAEHAKRYSQRHPETNKKAKIKYRENNLEKIRERDRLAKQRKRKSDPEGQKRRNEEYAIRKEAKRWEIAGRPRPDVCDTCKECNGFIVFDHCHTSNKFRGWLCDRCNKVLGLLKDDSSLFRKLADYLDRFNGEIIRKRQKEIA